MDALSTIEIDSFYGKMPALAIRRAEVKRSVKKVCRKLHVTEYDAAQNRILTAYYDTAELEYILLGALKVIAKRPYSAKEVCMILGITNRERLRWTKDGRLKRGGNEIIKRGQKIAVITYNTNTVEALAKDQKLIEKWRINDKSGHKSKY